MAHQIFLSIIFLLIAYSVLLHPLKAPPYLRYQLAFLSSVSGNGTLVFQAPEI
jgi:hypothetical protein